MSSVLLTHKSEVRDFDPGNKMNRSVMGLFLLLIHLVKASASIDNVENKLLNSIEQDTAANVSDLEHHEPDFDDLNIASVEYACQSLQYVADNLLAFTIEDLAIRLFTLCDVKIKKSLKMGCMWNLLHEAVYTDNHEATELLVETFKFDPNAWDFQFGNCVYLVQSVRMVKLLKSLGTDFTVKRACNFCKNPEDSALKRNNSAFYASLSDFDMRLECFCSMQQHIQSGSKRLKLDASRDQMYLKALDVVGKFTEARVANAHIKIMYCAEEVGIDMGGLTFEFINFMKEEMIKGDRVFETDPETGYLDFKVDAPNQEVKLAGFLVGLSIFHQCPMNIVFVPIVYYLILAKHHDINFVSVLKETSTTVMNSFEVIKGYTDIILAMIFGNREYLQEYIRATAREIVYIRRSAVYTQFLIGLGQAINYRKLSSFLSTEELKIVIRGLDSDYSARDWIDHHETFDNQAAFQDQYTWLFEIIDELTALQRRQLLKFFTSLECLPVGGFASFTQKIGIQVLLDSDTPDLELPKASTCSNLLKIYPYTSKAIMKKNLVMAIENCGGFYLL